MIKLIALVAIMWFIAGLAVGSALEHRQHRQHVVERVVIDRPVYQPVKMTGYVIKQRDILAAALPMSVLERGK